MWGKGVRFDQISPPEVAASFTPPAVRRIGAPREVLGGRLPEGYNIAQTPCKGPGGENRAIATLLRLKGIRIHDSHAGADMALA